MASTINQNINLNKNWFDKTITIYVWILGVLLIYWILLKLTNHSPTIDQMILVGVGILGGLLFKQQYDIGKLDGKFEGLKESCNKEFARIDNRFDKIENRLSKIESDVNSLKVDISFIKLKVGAL